MMVRLLDRALLAMAGFLTIALLAVVTAGIVSRALNRPFAWTDELSGFLMVWLACFGWMVATRRNAHIRIRFFQDLMPNVPKRWTEGAIQISAALFGAVVAYKSLHLIEANSDVEAVVVPVSTAWMYVPLLPAGLICLGQALADLARIARGGGQPEAGGLVE